MRLFGAALLMLLFSLEGNSQQTSKRFFSQVGEETDSALSYYYVFSDDERSTSYYTKTNQKRFEEGDKDFSDRRLRIYYYESGKKKAEGTFDHGLPSGQLKAYYETGSIQSELICVHPRLRKGKEPLIRIINYWDPHGVQIVKDGSGMCNCDLNPLSDGGTLERGRVEDGSKSGQWEGESSRKNYQYTETYERGVLIHGILQSDGEEIEYNELERYAEPVGGMVAFYKYVASELTYPKSARRLGIQGKVFVEFVIQKDGSLTNIKVIKGIGGDCDIEAARVIGLSPKWIPGKQRGRNVKQRYTLPIIFKIP